MAEKQKVEKPVATAGVFTKDAILKDKKYVAYKDLLQAVLETEKTYSHADVDKVIKEFTEREVK